jgi:hypothetical protein
LVGDELVEVGVGEHFALTLLAMAQGDVMQRAGSDVGVERLDAAAKFGSGLRCSLKPVRRRDARLVLAAGGLRRDGLRGGGLRLDLLGPQRFKVGKSFYRCVDWYFGKQCGVHACRDGLDVEAIDVICICAIGGIGHAVPP